MDYQVYTKSSLHLSDSGRGSFLTPELPPAPYTLDLSQSTGFNRFEELGIQTGAGVYLSRVPSLPLQQNGLLELELLVMD